MMVDESRDFSLKLTRVEICVTNGTSVVSMDFVLISSDLAAENPLFPEVMAVGIRPVELHVAAHLNARRMPSVDETKFLDDDEGEQ